MLGSAAVWQTAEQCLALFHGAGIPHAILGGVAVSLHGDQRNTIDVDLLIQREQSAAVKQLLWNAGFSGNEQRRWFVGLNGVPVLFRIAHEPAGDDRSVGVMLPDPSHEGEATEIERLQVLTLAPLLENELACGLGNLRRTHRDLVDVVELIAIHQLGSEFAARLHKRVRAEFRTLVQHARVRLTDRQTWRSVTLPACQNCPTDAALRRAVGE
ncbi:MAG: hypothetical protein ACK6D3_25870 [Planctomycetaceae bacterium]|jgi:hypothetical protein